MQTTYGLGTTIRGPAGGPGLASMGQQQQVQATHILGQAADAETSRNITNERLAAADKAGKAQLAASVGSAAGGMYAGATYGAAAGPWGALVGGLVGAFAGSLF